MRAFFEEIPYPYEVYEKENIFSDSGTFRSDYKVVPYDETLRDAGNLIEKFRIGTGPKFDINRYNFSLIQDENAGSFTHIYSQIVNDVLGFKGCVKVKTKTNHSEEAKTMKINKVYSSVFLDTRYSLVLNYEDLPVGFLGFESTRDEGVKISQLQSPIFTDSTLRYFRHSHNPMLEGFERRKVLVTFFEQYLKKHGFVGEVIIQAGENNIYYERNLHDAPLNARDRNERLVKTYNDTARELGYVQNKTPLFGTTNDFSKVIGCTPLMMKFQKMG